MYQENDFVIHRSNGLCRVIGTGYPEFGGVKSSSICYILENQRNKGRLYTPVENGETILRPVMNIEQSEELVGHLRSIEVIAEDNEKLREQADVEIAAILVLADIKNDFSGRKRLEEKYETRVYSLLKDEDIQLALRKNVLF